MKFCIIIIDDKIMEAIKTFDDYSDDQGGWFQTPVNPLGGAWLIIAMILMMIIMITIRMMMMITGYKPQ